MKREQAMRASLVLAVAVTLIVVVAVVFAASPASANVASCGLQPTEQQCKACCDADYDACTQYADSYFTHCGSYWDICYQNCQQVQCAPSDAGCYPSSLTEFLLSAGAASAVSK